MEELFSIPLLVFKPRTFKTVNWQSTNSAVPTPQAMFYWISPSFLSLWYESCLMSYKIFERCQKDIKTYCLLSAGDVMINYSNRSGLRFTKLYLHSFHKWQSFSIGMVPVKVKSWWTSTHIISVKVPKLPNSRFLNIVILVGFNESKNLVFSPIFLLSFELLYMLI
jgi:hypothetical protein